MSDTITLITKLFAENSEAAAALKAAQTKEEAVELFKGYGINITVEEFIEIGKEITSDELSEEMLLLVSGGGWLRNAWNGVRDFFHGFLDAF